MNGFIKIDRRITEWGWYTNKSAFKLFFHLLLSANYKDADFCGIRVKRGQLVRSVSTLSAETGLTADEIRTAIKNLVKTGDITSTPHSKYTLFTVLNYEYFQSDNTVIDRHFPNSSQALPEQFPNTSQQYNKNNKNNKNNNYNNTHEESSFDENEFFEIALERSRRKAAALQENKNPQHAVADS